MAEPVADDDARSATPERLPSAALGDFLRTGYLIHDVSRLRRQFYDQQSRHLGITRAQWWVLFNLARHNGDPLNQNELAELLELGSASVGELVLRLERGGFVERVPDRRDRRAKRVTIAVRGLEVLEHMRVVARAHNARIMSGISAAEQVQLDQLLTRMKGNLGQLLGAAADEAAGDGDPQLPDLTGACAGAGAA